MGANQFYQSIESLEFLESVDSKAIRAILKKANDSELPIKDLRNTNGLSFIEALGIIQIDVLKARRKLFLKMLLV